MASHPRNTHKRKKKNPAAELFSLGFKGATGSGLSEAEKRRKKRLEEERRRRERNR